MKLNNSFSWATLALLSLAVVVALVGGGVVIWGHDGALTFQQYINYMQEFAKAIGLLAIGRGIAAGLTNHGANMAGVSGELSSLRGGSQSSTHLQGSGGHEGA